MQRVASTTAQFTRSFAISAALFFTTFTSLSASSTTLQHPVSPAFPHSIELGTHVSLSCSDCHQNRPGSAAILCHDCHQPPDDLQNISNTCSPCHTESAITSIHAANESLKQCSRCHQNHYLPPHYGHHCDHCHNMLNWGKIELSGTPQRCQSCHDEAERRCSFSSMPCLFCHQRPSWVRGAFKHPETKSCELCHDRPADHRTGPCYFCHETEDWSTAS